MESLPEVSLVKANRKQKKELVESKVTRMENKGVTIETFARGQWGVGRRGKERQHGRPVKDPTVKVQFPHQDNI